MKKSAAAVAAAVAVLALGLLSGVALAGDHGVHGSQNAQQGTTSDQQPGVKPSNGTSKDQTCTTGGGQGSSATCQSSTYPGSSDASKRYGNGKTAAQIANGKGAPSGTPIYGPGNSQPHKICGRDVHAYGKGHRSKCGSTQEKPPPTTTTTVPKTTSSAATETSTVAAATVTTTTSSTSTSTTTTTAAASLGSSTPTPPSSTAPGGVLGASKTLHAPSTHHAPGGVLGAAKTLVTPAASRTLPFTGLRLWIFAAIALGLIGTGVAMRLAPGRRAN